MVVIYDRFVFFSVEKFFIPLLYSCLNILVQKSCEKEKESECAYVCMCLCLCVLHAYVERSCASACVCECVGMCACEQGGASRKIVRKVIVSEKSVEGKGESWLHRLIVDMTIMRQFDGIVRTRKFSVCENDVQRKSL